RHRPNHLP
ncbi:hypothetical protein BN1723_018963, partial [Verticillium longisporum]